MCENNYFTNFDDLKINSIEKTDGYKFILNKNEWVMIRPSGTEPILRIYAEGSSQKQADYILKKTIKTILL